MITVDYARTMAAYNAAMNRRWYEAADALSDAQRRADRGAFFGSLHGTLCHIAWGDRMWMSRFDGWERPTVAQKDSGRMIEDWEALKATRWQFDAAIEDWAGRLTQAALDGALTWFSGGSQREMTMNLGLLVVHLFNHQTHHRGQAHALLTGFGQDPGATDLPWVV